MKAPVFPTLSTSSGGHSASRSDKHCIKRNGEGLTWPMTLALLGVNFIYAGTGVFCKMASRQAPETLRYWLCVGGALGVLGTYALLWQQIIARVSISSAYMFRGTALVFSLLLAACLWGESITLNNIAGAVISVVGITLYVRP